MRRAPAFAGALGLVQLVLAFVVAPQSCAGGLEIYVWVGVAALVAVCVATVLWTRRLGPWRCAAWTLALTAGIALAWVAGLFAADVRIVCRLF